MAAWPLLAHAALAADGAEFAIRWDPADGGPRSIDEVAAMLNLPQGKHKSFVVRYFSVAQPVGAAAGTRAIARERTSGHAAESTYKLRSTAPFPSNGEFASWRCPFKHEARQKSEVDVGWTADGVAQKRYSLSCDADGFIKTLLPAQYEAKSFGCNSQVLRVQAGDIKIERWSLPSGEPTFEVSWKGQDTAADLESFAGRVVRPLMARGVKALRESKTELGSSC